MVVDYEGRILAQGDRGEQIVGATLDVGALRHHRKTVKRHNLPAMFRARGIRLFF